MKEQIDAIPEVRDRPLYWENKNEKTTISGVGSKYNRRCL